MTFKRPIFCVFMFIIVCCLAQDLPQKSLKASDAAKLAKKQLAAQSAALLIREEYDDRTETIPVSDLGITVPPEEANDTIKTDHHIYYNSTFYSNPNDGKRFWINLDELPEEIVISHDRLSHSHRQATTVVLSFEFPFYGNPLKNVTIATGGFLYMGDYLHNWIAATQYVAPLMANFDTRLSPNSKIKYADNGTAFTVLWENVFIQNEQKHGKDEDGFTFQVTLLKNGDIIFAYKNIPFSVSSISTSEHPVKIGLSDAYVMEQTIYFIRRKTVYEYHRIHNKDWEVSNNTALYFTALPTCNTFKDCSSCLSSGLKLQCNWCVAVNRCSDGIDRQSQSWNSHECPHNLVTTCPGVPSSNDKTVKPDVSVITKNDLAQPVTAITTNTTIAAVKPTLGENVIDPNLHSNEILESNQEASFLHEEKQASQASVTPGAIITVLVFLTALIAAGVWVVYAYKYPQSSSGQFLIKYRPSQWVMRKGSAVPASLSQR